LTKVSWVSQTLTNGTVPIDLSVDVLRQLAINSHSPAKLTNLPSAQIAVTTMVHLNATAVHEILHEMANTTNWVGEGWDPATQPGIVATVTGWIHNATESLASFMDVTDHKKLFTSAFLEEARELHLHSSVDKQFAALKELAAAKVLKSQKAVQHAQLQEKIKRHQNIFYAESTRELYKKTCGK
jgi:hypothetical protein